MFSGFWASHHVVLEFDTDVSQEHWHQPVLLHCTETAINKHIYVQNCHHHLTCFMIQTLVEHGIIQANKTSAGMQGWQYFSPSLLSSIFPSYLF